MMKKLDEIKAILQKIENCGSSAIKSNDEKVIDKLNHKLEMAEDEYNTMKEGNAYYKEYKTLDGCPGISEKKRAWLTRPHVYNCGENGTPLEFEGKPFASYELSAIRQEVRRLKDRIERITAIKAAGTSENENTGIEGLKIVENAEAMRVQLIFDDKPDEAVRDILKHNGFRWSPRSGAWQRDLNAAGKSAAKTVLEKLKNL